MVNCCIKKVKPHYCVHLKESCAVKKKMQVVVVDLILKIIVAWLSLASMLFKSLAQNQHAASQRG